MDKIIMNIAQNSQLIKISLSSVIATAGGFLAAFFGGIDKLLITLITMIVIDYVTGVIKAVYKKKVSSSVGFKGIMKKLLMLMMVGLAVTLQNVLPVGIPLREITILFFVANEGFSILENTSEIIPLPEKIRSVLYQIQQKSEEELKDAEKESEPFEEEQMQPDPENGKQTKIKQ